MQFEIDDDVPFVRLFDALASIGLTARLLPGSEVAFQVSLRDNARTDRQIRAGMKHLCLIEPRHLVRPVFEARDIDPGAA